MRSHPRSSMFGQYSKLNCFHQSMDLMYWFLGRQFSRSLYPSLNFYSQPLIKCLLYCLFNYSQHRLYLYYSWNRIALSCLHFLNPNPVICHSARYHLILPLIVVLAILDVWICLVCQLFFSWYYQSANCIYSDFLFSNLQFLTMC